MILRTIALSGIKGYPSPARLDVAALPEGVVAITGPNGAGKSTLLRVWRAVLDRSARLTLLAQAETREAWAEASFTLNGQGRTVRFSLDGPKGASEVSVLDDDGAPALATTSVRAYDAWTPTALPSPDVFLAAMFAAQGEPSFLDKTPAERKAVVLRALGVEKLEAMATRARYSADTVRVAIAAKDMEALTVRRGADVAAAEAAESAARTQATALESDLAHARADLSHARASHAALVAAYEDAVAAKGRADAAQRAFDEAHRLLQNVVDERDRLERKLVDAAAVEAAVAALPAAEADVEAARRALDETRTKLDAATAEAKAARHAAITAKAALTTATTRERSARIGAQGLEAVERHAAELPGLDARVVELTTARDAAAEQVEQLRDAGADVSAQRIEGLRAGLSELACGEYPKGDAPTIAQRYLDADDDIVRAAAAAPARLAAARTALSEARTALETATISRDAARQSAAKVESMRALAAQARDAAEALVAAGREVETAVEREREAEAAEVKARDPYAYASVDHDVAVKVHYRYRTDAARAPDIAAARAALAQVAERETAARATLEERRRARDLAPEPPTVPPAPADLSGPERAIEAAERAAEQARAAVTRAEMAVEQARAAAARAAEIERERDVLDEKLADWLYVAETLGTRGLVALLVDAAGPELSEITSALLRECYGPRWSVTFRTTREGADGREIEDLVCEVTDANESSPDPRDATAFSGGQRVIVGEAISLALATIAIRRAGLQGCTLIRDESGAALDAETAPLYPRMLRTAARLAGAARVLFVTHDPTIPPLCDGVVRVAAGEIRIE
jgi:exonuclease SbcC